MTNNEEYSMNADVHSDVATNMQPSHQVSDLGNKVKIHDLELFVGHIPGFDAEDSGMDDLDDEAIETIITRTKAHMAAGSNPKLVMLHQEEGKDAPPEALGDIVAIQRKDIHIRTEDGEDYSGPGIIGDVVMSRSDFDDYISTNRFPRRSAEIWKDGHMSEVALLGRETPARPLRDTRFGKAGQKITYTRPVTFAEVSPGGSNTFVPTLGDEDKKDHDMPETEDRMTIEHDGDDKDLISKLRAENDTLRDEMEQLKAQLNGNEEETEEEETHYQDDEEMPDREMPDEDRLLAANDDEEEEEDKEVFARISRLKNGKSLVGRIKKIKSERDSYKKLARGLGLKVLKSKYTKVLDELEHEGYRIRNHRKHMLKELMSSKDTEGKVAFWREVLTKDPLGRRLTLTESRITGKSEYSAHDRKSASDRAVARMTKEGMKADQFQSVFEQELKTG